MTADTNHDHNDDDDDALIALFRQRSKLWNEAADALQAAVVSGRCGGDTRKSIAPSTWEQTTTFSHIPEVTQQEASS